MPFWSLRRWGNFLASNNIYYLKMANKYIKEMSTISLSLQFQDSYTIRHRTFMLGWDIQWLFNKKKIISCV